MTVCRCWAGRVSLCVQQYNISSVTSACRSVPSNLSFLFSSLSRRCIVECSRWKPQQQLPLIRLWDGQIGCFFLSHLIASSARVCSAEGADEHADTATQWCNVLTHWWGSHRGEPTNQSSLQWCWLKKSHCQIIWKLFFLWRQVFLLYRRKKKRFFMFLGIKCFINQAANLQNTDRSKSSTYECAAVSHTKCSNRWNHEASTVDYLQ